MELKALRERIDRLDEQVLELLEERATIAAQVAQAKAADGAVVYVPARERDVLTRLESRAKRLPPAAVRHVFQEIMSACRAIQAPLRVAFLGPLATFSHLATQRRFGLSAEGVPVSSLESVLAEVARGASDLGVVPVENSSEGIIRRTVDALLTTELTISGEIALRVRHALLASPGTKVAEIQRVYSHQMAIAQCRASIAAHVPHAKLVETASTAEAARRAADEPGAGAIASELAARLYGLEALRDRFEDSETNVTRFLIVGGAAPAPTGRDKTCLIVELPDRAGILADALATLAARGVSVACIESRPSRRRPWEYIFYLELDGHASDPGLAASLVELKQLGTTRVLGSYPRADIE